MRRFRREPGQHASPQRRHPGISTISDDRSLKRPLRVSRALPRGYSGVPRASLRRPPPDKLAVPTQKNAPGHCRRTYRSSGYESVSNIGGRWLCRVAAQRNHATGAIDPAGARHAEAHPAPAPARAGARRGQAGGNRLALAAARRSTRRRAAPDHPGRSADRGIRYICAA